MTTPIPTTVLETGPDPVPGPLIPATTTARPYRLEAVADLLPGHHILIGDPAVEAIVITTTKTIEGWEITTLKDGAVGGRRAVRRIPLGDGQAHADVTVGRLADIDDLAAIRHAFLERDELAAVEPRPDGALNIVVTTPLGDWIITI